MRKFLTLTYALFPLFLGFVIGGAISGSSTTLTFGIILLVLDVIIGITLQNIVDRASYSNNYEISREIQGVIGEFLIEKLLQEIEDQESANKALQKEQYPRRNILCEENNSRRS